MWEKSDKSLSSFSFCYIDTQAGMKRGLEEMSAETSGPKKTKTVNNGDVHGEQWTRVEKKKKKIRKAESKMDVCTKVSLSTFY
jgi:hypothetical protein